MWVCPECRGALITLYCQVPFPEPYLLPCDQLFEGQVDLPLTHLPVHPQGSQEGLPVAQVQSVPVSDSCYFSWQLFVIHTPDRRAAGWS